MRRDDLGARIETCTGRAGAHVKTARRNTTLRERTHAIEQARRHLADRRALRLESDRLSRYIDTLQRQVGAIVNSHLDTVIVSAMRQYTSAASRLGLPARTEEVNLLNSEITACMEQADEFQSALGETYSDPAGAEDDDLQQELDELLGIAYDPPAHEAPPTHSVPARRSAAAEPLPPAPSTERAALLA